MWQHLISFENTLTFDLAPLDSPTIQLYIVWSGSPHPQQQPDRPDPQIITPFRRLSPI